jgi:hypothetical protein
MSSLISPTRYSVVTLTTRVIFVRQQSFISPWIFGRQQSIVPPFWVNSSLRWSEQTLHSDHLSQFTRTELLRYSVVTLTTRVTFVRQQSFVPHFEQTLRSDTRANSSLWSSLPSSLELSFFPFGRIDHCRYNDSSPKYTFGLVIIVWITYAGRLNCCWTAFLSFHRLTWVEECFRVHKWSSLQSHATKAMLSRVALSFM